MAEREPRRVEVTIEGDTRNGRVLLDGKDISHLVRGITIGAHVDERMPAVTLDLVVDVLHAAFASSNPVVADACRDTLLELGWTPPAEPKVITRGEPHTWQPPPGGGWNCGVRCDDGSPCNVIWSAPPHPQEPG